MAEKEPRTGNGSESNDVTTARKEIATLLNTMQSLQQHTITAMQSFQQQQIKVMTEQQSKEMASLEQSYQTQT